MNYKLHYLKYKASIREKRCNFINVIKKREIRNLNTFGIYIGI